MAASIPVAGDVLRIPAYTSNYDQDSSFVLTWSQTLRTKTETYYLVDAKNISQGNTQTVLYIQASYFKNGSSPESISKISQNTNEDGSFDVKIDDKFQYGQKNKEGVGRFVVYHNKSNKPYQHRFLISTIQGNAAEWAKTLAHSAGAGELADSVHKLGTSFIGDFLHTF